MDLSEADIENTFSYHPSNEQTAILHEQVRDICKGAALTFLEILPESEERRMSVNKLREAMYWANSAIACKIPSSWPGAPGSTGVK